MTSTTNTSDIPQAVPMFLRKTYHMIDSCDPAIACWSDDGETFVVKDPSKFEKEIIPQFFKHSKFSSFVRQLNFYSFRKIKYADTIRLNPKLEAETANFWRFRHENFQRGQPQMLTEIKRMTAAQSKAAAAATQVSPDGVSSSYDASIQQNDVMKSEIDTLKKKLEEMNKNMSELTSMVQKVSLEPSPSSSSSEPAGNKRKKVEMTYPDAAPESMPSGGVVVGEDVAFDLFLQADSDDSMFDNDNNPTQFDSMMPESIESQPAARESSIDSNMTDNDFVDQLFTVFAGGSDEGTTPPVTGEALQDFSFEPAESTPTRQTHVSRRNSNRPNEELMDRLSEALAVLPKEMQEQIVNRLIASITAGTIVDAAVTPEKAEASQVPSDEASSISSNNDETQSVVPAQTSFKDQKVIGMPLAAATLASLLSYYSDLVQATKASRDAKHASSGVKSIPVIPCHA